MRRFLRFLLVDEKRASRGVARLADQRLAEVRMGVGEQMLAAIVLIAREARPARSSKSCSRCGSWLAWRIVRRRRLSFISVFPQFFNSFYFFKRPEVHYIEGNDEDSDYSKPY